jgi:hypothetical protein
LSEFKSVRLGTKANAFADAAQRSVTTLRKGYASKTLRTLDLSDDYVEKTRPITRQRLAQAETRLAPSGKP